jgi:hypothetical protein
VVSADSTVINNDIYKSKNQNRKKLEKKQNREKLGFGFGNEIEKKN